MTDVEDKQAVRSAHEVLSWSRFGVEPALRGAVERMPESMRVISGYHFGWRDEHGQPTGGNSGKAIRPALTLLAAEAVGSVAAAAMSAAVAVELVHNFSLLHDDVMDRDTTRRHRPTAWSVFGVNSAILAGDSMLALALDVLADSGHPSAQQGMRMISASVQGLLDGQAADMAFEERGDVDLLECVKMAEGKTGALLGCACAIGALFGGGSTQQVQELRGFGEALGLAFQFADDLLGIWGDPSVTGKPVFSDLRNRKKSLPVVAALNSGTEAGRELDTLYHSDHPLSPSDLSRAADLVDLAGGRAWSQARADDLLTRARTHLTNATPRPRAAAELDALAELATHRDH
ncbi:family 2 encapsulin nanocompartment cargo protein polyprenyl transferase [Umezawaea tangerina]|uniref:Geranylgeranyl diphosphate synthase type I n=1 Tax=Umezawaea tangerina TaxID=84725 RepID=A0A2T0SVA3_9PSEU|nr:family 2 encapsulin nanocompartment cargo protein polyprenyl transferase [Umezawaea tangerina]PRY37344.1 geranylgeranyl diphosphate synthase type I [Umezawaea tangerina]